MNHHLRRLLITTCVVALALLSACDHSGDEHTDEHAADEHAAADRADEHAPDEHAEAVVGAPTSLDELPEGVNAVQHEMRLLDEAMRTTLTLIANDQLEGIPGQIQKVHPARQITVEAIEKGAYQTPKNGDRMDDFVALDDVFHEDLKALLKASQEDDLEAATDAYGDIVQGCTSCHTEFRF